MTGSYLSKKKQLKQSKKLGSSNAGEPEFLVVGRLLKPHGVQGEINLLVLTDFPERLIVGATVFFGDERHPLVIDRIRQKGENLIIGFENTTDRDKASNLRSKMLFVRSDDVPPLPDGDYYHHEMIGIIVVLETGEAIGKVKEIIETGANDVYVISPEIRESKEILIPAIDEVIREINLETKQMIIRPLPGLLPEID